MQINWSERALNDLSDILRYVVDSFGESVAYRVNDEINNDVDSLAQFPKMGRILYHDKASEIIYRTFSSKYHKIVYSMKDDTVYNVTLWNTRRDGKKLTALLSKIEK